MVTPATSQARVISPSLLDSVQEKIGFILKDRNLTVGFVVAAAVVILTIVILLYLNRRRALRRTVMIIGLCDAGKTLMFTQLVHNRYVGTHTSIKHNSGMYVPNSKAPLRLVDLPGHERLWFQFFNQFKEFARAIIFVIDSSTIQREVKEVAEILYTILCDDFVVQNCPPLLVACNKQDTSLSKSAKVIQSLLEKEMNTLRITRSAALESTSDTGNNNSFLGKKGEDFEFAHLSPLKVEFLGCNSTTKSNDGCDIKAVHDWLLKIA